MLVHYLLAFHALERLGLEPRPNPNLKSGT
jgi:hypothetical protein